MAAANFRWTVNWLGVRVGSHASLSQHSSDEPGDFGHDDSTINIVVVIIISIYG